MKSLRLAAAFGACLVAVAALAADSKWVEASSSASGALYYDSMAVRSDGQFVSLWVLNDFKEPQHDGKLSFRSMISRQLIDCATNVVATDFVAYRAGAMGEGDVVYSSDAIRDRQRAAPGSVLGHLVELHCK